MHGFNPCVGEGRGHVGRPDLLSDEGLAEDCVVVGAVNDDIADRGGRRISVADPGGGDEGGGEAREPDVRGVVGCSGFIAAVWLSFGGFGLALMIISRSRFCACRAPASTGSDFSI